MPPIILRFEILDFRCAGCLDEVPIRGCKRQTPALRELYIRGVVCREPIAFGEAQNLVKGALSRPIKIDRDPKAGELPRILKELLACDPSTAKRFSRAHL